LCPPGERGPRADLAWLAPERPALEVARDLLGATLCRRRGDGEVLRWPITEVEAYLGPEDRACHAHVGRTRRTEVMFRPGGVWYVYLCYGVHWLANLVTGPEAHPAAVLIRGAGEVAGPGRLTKALAVDGSFNTVEALPRRGLWIEPGTTVAEGELRRGPRVGVDYAGAEWAAAPLRLIWEAQWPGKPRRRPGGR